MKRNYLDRPKPPLCNLKKFVVVSALIIIILTFTSRSFKRSETPEKHVSENKKPDKPLRTIDKGKLNSLKYTESEDSLAGVLGAKEEDPKNKLEKYDRLRNAFVYKEKNIAIVNDYFNESLSFEQRAKNLVLHLGLNRLLHMSTYARQGTTLPIESLGIKAFAWHTECLHGQVGTKGTGFPHSINLAATFDPDLVKRVASAIGDEIRAINKKSKELRNAEVTNHGLNCFAPVANIMRHPLWGRNQETYGEDPELVKTMIRAFITGIQGDDPKYLKVSAGCKHFIAHSGPENSMYDSTIKVSDRDFYLTFLPPFKECVEAGASTIMCTNHRFNGTPSCVHRAQKEILRDKLNFKGVIVAEDRAISNLLQSKLYGNVSKAAFDVFKNGVNLESGGYSMYHLKNFIQTKELSVSEIRESVAKLFTIRMKLGEFDQFHPYQNIPFTEVQHEEHNQLALEAALKSIVLLKNEIKHDNGFLPLSESVKSRGTILLGPFINNLQFVYGNAAAYADNQFGSSVHDGIVFLANKTYPHNICNTPACGDSDEEQIDGLLDKAFKNDASLVILTLGTGSELEGTGNDRKTLNLPENQEYMLKKSILLASKKNLPIVLLLFSGGPLNITLAVKSNQVKSILACLYPGQMTGHAIYRILTKFGQFSTPSGRLPFTWHANATAIDSIESYDMQVSGHTYRYFRGEPLFPFGYGLSYSKFHYYNVSVYPSQISTSMQDSEAISVTVMVKNIGRVSCDEIIQVYVEWLETPFPMPNIELVAFKRKDLPATIGRPITETFTLTKKHLSIFQDKENGFKLFPGKIRIYAGGILPKSRFSNYFGAYASTILNVKGPGLRRPENYDPQTPKYQYQLNPKPIRGQHPLTRV
ncbi:DgyrCDS13186 [Dimorphilus gyrociliatus]|uniref:DgyrCDS13186 n=1 Tax=Dimorphilus gyrociliatus TaxID=2664684 RepID=A0A7I8WA09_9ANNE|nr:DgyrCDS13186 [Dimorphilus gyrociliatus]